MANTEPHVDSAGGSGEVMDRWKTDNCESGGDRLSSRSTSLSRRLIGLAGVAALTVGGAGAVLLGAGSAYAANSDIASNPYSIGSVVSGGLTFTTTSANQGATGVNDTFSFVVPSTQTNTDLSLSFTGLDSVTSTPALASAIVQFGSNPAATVAATLTSATSSTSLGSINIASLGNAASEAGQTVTVTVDGLKNGTDVTSETISADLANTTVATTTATLTAASTATASLVSSAPSVAGSTLTASAVQFGSSANSSLSFAVTSSAPATGTGYNPAGAGIAVTASTMYTVSYTTSSNSTPVTFAAVAAASGGTGGAATAETATITEPSAIPANAIVKVVASPVFNGATAGSDYITFLAGTTAPGLGSAASGTTAEFAVGNAFPSVNLSVAPATTAATSTYSLSFAVPAGTSAIGATITDNNSADVGVPTGYAIFDATNPAANTSSANAPTVTNGAIQTSLGSSVAAGDSITIDYYGVASTATGTSVSASVVGTGSSSYTIAAVSNTVSLGAVSNTSGLNVAVSNSTASAIANYTISGLVASGPGLQTGSIVVDFSQTAPVNGVSPVVQTGLVLPPGADVTLTDLTTGATLGQSTAVVENATSTFASLTITLSGGVYVNAGDNLQITVSGVQNPSAASTAEYATVLSTSSLPIQTGAVAATFPTAATTYPNGAFVQSGGQIDVIAGGVGFGIPTFNDYQQIATSDSSSVVSGSFPTGTAVRTGTLLKVLGSPAIYVIGTNGDAYPFSTPTEFTSDGYSAMSVVNVPNLGSLTTGSGAAPTAAVTMPDGALVQSGSTIYVYAGGKAFGIPTFADYQTIAAATGTQVVMGTVSNTAATSLTAGTLIQPIGSAGIWVSDGTSIYQFSTASQFASDGYNGANVVPVPNATGLTQA